MKGPKLHVGLTGGICCGKSTVSRILSQFTDVLVIDTDSLAKRLIFSDGLYITIRKIFGSDVCTQGKVGKEELSKVLFTDQAKRKELEKVVHPLVWQEVKKLARESDQGIILVESALIFETGWSSLFDLVVVVACSETEQERRLQTERKMTEMAAKQRIGAQMPLVEKVQRADLVIWSDCNEVEMRRKVEKLYQNLVELKEGKLK